MIRTGRLAKVGLRLKIFTGVILPVLVGLGLILYLHEKREQELIKEQTLQVAVQIADAINSSLRHAMLTNDQEMLTSVINDATDIDTVSRIQIVNNDGVIKEDTNDVDVGAIHRLSDVGCVECHKYSPAERPRFVTLSASPNMVRVASPISNADECAACHDETSSQLGVLFIDIPTADVSNYVEVGLNTEIAVSILSLLFLAISLSFLLDKFVIRRIGIINEHLHSLSTGDLSSRLALSDGITDELDILTITINEMADEIEERVEAEHKMHTALQAAVSEERRRIARELHDGMAQLSGFVKAKAGATRLLLLKDQREAAIANLTQLEEAARDLSLDVRESILNLRSSEEIGDGLAVMLEHYIERFRQLSDLEIQTFIPRGLESLRLDSDVELNILRIVQEALSNARKHAKAALVSITIEIEDEILRVIIEDNGVGFDVEAVCDDALSYGLCGMRDRADSIGGVFSIDSELGVMTQVIVTVPITENKGN